MYQYDERYPEQLHPMAWGVATFLSKLISIILDFFRK